MAHEDQIIMMALVGRFTLVGCLNRCFRASLPCMVGKSSLEGGLLQVCKLPPQGHLHHICNHKLWTPPSGTQETYLDSRLPHLLLLPAPQKLVKNSVLLQANFSVRKFGGILFWSIRSRPNLFREMFAALFAKRIQDKSNPLCQLHSAEAQLLLFGCEKV